jgi:hypothetical protein
MPALSDLRDNWLVVRLGAVDGSVQSMARCSRWLGAVDDTEMRELVLDAWTMVVPKRVAAARLQT